METTLQNIHAFVEKKLGVTIEDASRNLFEAGWIDSFGMVELIVALEKEFNVKVSVFDFAENDSFTLERITETLQKAGS